MEKQKKIIIIGAGILQVPAIIKAKQMGLYVYAQDMDPNAPGFKLADNTIQLSTNDIENSVNKALQLMPDAVMTLASDMPIRTVAAIGEKCGLSTISTKTALNATDKGRMRSQLNKYGVPIPRFFIASSFEKYMDAASHFAGKFIVKPADNSGSRGVYLTDQTSDLTEVYHYVKEHSRSGDILVEEFMVGPEVSVETMTVNGVTHVVSITDKLTTGAPHFIEMGHSIPSQLPLKLQDEIINVAISGINALGVEVGPAHTEIIVTEEGPKIVEIGARLGGDNITTHLVPLATGVNMVEWSIRLAIGENVEISPNQHKGAAIRYLKSAEGILEDVQNVQEAKAMEGIKEIAFTKRIGDTITAVNSSTDRIGFVIAQGDLPLEAIEKCEKASTLIKINVSNNGED
ncbi:ATP-grasp domain-containing protein [Bacillus sp. ISL-7]|uniref:ATP-grasp domain-containing protein n=1 Tax=Bacillus sp. ISL-7 TaxID=2819136 RepID=UPI001BE993EF|nr:ATP-grasp domain-containing protein [Bacillus sp. ISL-7]MBT2738383.1 ATP-grasp domain-containing protein [Bacillus sp. ISL-7]